MPKPKTINRIKRTAAQRNARMMAIIKEITVQAGLLAEARIKDRHELSRRLWRSVSKLLEEGGTAVELCEIFKSCSYLGETTVPECSVDGDLIFIHGHYSVGELRKLMNW